MSGERGGITEWLSERLNLTEIFSLLTSYGLFHGELDTRKPLRQALREALEQPLPSYARWPRVLGLVVVVLLGLEILTGGMLALYYLPTPQSAHASMGTLLREVHFGWFVHQLHFWGAQALIAVLLIRLLRFFVQAVYSPPRELLWVAAFLLLLVCLHAELTGAFLTFTASAFWSGVRALEVIGSVPVYGWLLLHFLGWDGVFAADLTLIRFYVLHTAVLPAMAVVLIYLHFSTVRRVGLTEAPGETPAGGSAALRRHVANLAIVLTVIFGTLVTLAVLAPLPFDARADPYQTVPGVGPPWYLLAPFGFLEWTAPWLPRWAGGTVLLLAFLAVLGLPFLRRDRRAPRRRLAWAAAALAVAAWLVLTLYGARVT